MLLFWKDSLFYGTLEDSGTSWMALASISPHRVLSRAPLAQQVALGAPGCRTAQPPAVFIKPQRKDAKQRGNVHIYVCGGE